MNVFSGWRGCVLFLNALLVSKDWVSSFLQQKLVTIVLETLLRN
jgi:hypothetical protein